MAKVQYGIIDTGRTKSDATTGTQFTRVNSGSEVTIPIKSIVLGGTLNSDETPTPGKTSSGLYSLSEVDTNSVNNPVLTVVAKYKNNVSGDITNLKNLYDMKFSKGVKIFFYQSTTDGTNTTPNIIGTTDTDHSSTGNYTSGTTPHLHVFVKDVRINENTGTPGGIITATITLIQTG